MFITASTRILFSLIGAIPLFLTKSNYNGYIDAFFEMVSGFTTSGASVAINVELLPLLVKLPQNFLIQLEI